MYTFIYNSKYINLNWLLPIVLDISNKLTFKFLEKILIKQKRDVIYLRNSFIELEQFFHKNNEIKQYTLRY